MPMGALPWLSPSPSGLPPSPPPKKVNRMNFEPLSRLPDIRSALTVAKQAAFARSGAALASAPKMTSMVRMMFSV